MGIKQCFKRSCKPGWESAENSTWYQSFVKERAEFYIVKNFRLQWFLLSVGSTLLRLELCREAIGLRLEDRLDGAWNFVPWKARLVLILGENELWDEVVHNTTTNPIVVPASTDARALPAFNKKDIKARRIILDVVEDHVIPHISSKTRAYKMWDALTSLFQSSNENGFEREIEEYKDGQS